MAAPTPTRRPSALRSPPPHTPSTSASTWSPTPTSAHGRLPRTLSNLSTPMSTPTPTPTRRSSHLTSAPPSASATSAAAEQRRARRAELRHFYGLKEGVKDGKGVKEGKEGKEAAGALPADQRDINGVAFDAKGYYDDLFHKSTLEELMKAASSLSADIGKLHGDRHSLVYNHHHQLFAAGDTISHLNSRTPQLLGIMTSLQQSFSTISQLVDEVAMPDVPAAPIAQAGKRQGAPGAGQGAWQNRLRRIRLMAAAEEPPEKVRAVAEKLRDDIRASVDGGKDGADSENALLKELEEVLAGLPAEEG